MDEHDFFCKHVVNAGEGSVRFFGRVSRDILPGKVFFNWSCSGFEFSFCGTAAFARLYTAPAGGQPVPPPAAQARVGVYLDGQSEAAAIFMLDGAEKWYTLFEGLPAARHTVRVVKLSECGSGRAAVSQIGVDGDAPPAPTLPKPRRLEFLGDSITCGYGNECLTGSSDFVTGEENADRTYAALLARRLDAEIRCVCASGNGIWHDYGMNTVNLIPELYRYTDKMLSGHFGKAPETWDFSTDKADLVIIKLGANDSRYCDGWDLPESARTEELRAARREGFARKLHEFLDDVRRLRPNTPILYVYESDMVLRDTIYGALISYRQRNADAALHFQELASKRPWEGVGANGHWSVATHNRAAIVLEPVVRSILGWETPDFTDRVNADENLEDS